MKIILLLFLALVLATIQTNAATYFLKTANVGAFQTASSWNTGGVNGGGTNASNFTTVNDIFIVSTGQTATSGASVTFASGVTLQINGTGIINITGNGAVLTVNGTIVFGGTSANQMSLPGSQSGQTFTLGSGATLKTVNTNGITGTNCSLPASKSKAVVNLDVASNYELNGTSAQQTLGLPATVANLTINNAAGVTLRSGNIAINGTLNVSAGNFALDINNNAVTVTGDITNNGTITVSSGAISLGGNWNQNGTFTKGTGTVTFNGIGTQTIGGSAATIFNTLTINKTGGSVILSGNITTTNFTSTAGTFDPATFLLTATTPTLTAGTLRVGATLWSTNYSFTVTPPALFTIEYYNASPTINGAITYQNLQFSGNGTAGASAPLTIQGDLTNTGGGILNFGANGVILNGSDAANNIAGFTTTGIVSMTKTAGIATFTGNVSGVDLTINGSGGTLNLGAGLTHTFTGTWFRLAGTLDNSSSLLQLGGSVSGTGGTFTASTGTVEWNSSSAQNVAAVTYNNLTISGNNTKTLGGALTINGLLTINSGATLILGGATTVIGTVAINNSTTLNTSNNALTFNGNFTNSGTFTAGSSPITFSGTASQSIAGFSTTGLVSMTKASGTVTLLGNVNGSGLTINGSSGILNLGTGLTHVFTGAWTRTAGTLQGNSSLLQIGGSFSGTGGTFTANSGTVEWNQASGTQTVAGVIYNNLTLSGGGTKTTTGVTVTGILSMEGTATASVAPTYGTAAKLQYNSSIPRTAGSEWNTPFAATGGIIILNTGAITMNSAESLTSPAPLTINSGATLSTGNFALTVGGTFNNSGTFNAGTDIVTFTGTFTNTGTFNPGATGTINFNDGSNIVPPATYFNLTLSGSGVKTTTGVTVNGILSMEGTATASVAPTYGSSATLQYNTTSGRNAGVEWISPFVATGGIIIASTGTITLNSDEVLNASAPLTIGSGATLAANTFTLTLGGTFTKTGNFTAGSGTVIFNAAGAQSIPANTFNILVLSGSGTKTLGGTTTLNGALTINNGVTLATGNNTLTLGGDFTNNGTFTAGSSPISFAGTGTQSIAGFTTTGLVSMTKTGGIATLQGNVNGAGLTINGSGGTLNLGSGLTHTFTGVVTLTAGTLNGGSSTLNENSVSATAWNGTGTVFTAGTGTVVFGAAGAQTLSASATTFNNLTFSGSNTKTLGSATTLNGSLIINTGVTLATGNNSLTLSGDFTNNGTFTAGSSPITFAGTGTQSIAGFTTTGLVSMTKTGGIATLQGNVNGAGLTINGFGGTLNLGSGLTHTFTGTWTRTNGTLNANSSLLQLGGSVSGIGGTFTASIGTVVWNSGGAQTIAGLTYNNVTFSGSGTKTLGNAITVNGVLTINSGVTLAMSTFLVTVNGDFINHGLTNGSGGVTIGGTAAIQNIDGFTITGTISMTKTGGVATFQGNVNGGALAINGSGGILDLGVGLTHTFTGNVTLTAGTLNGGSSTLNENSVSATAWNGTGSVFNPGTGTVIFGAAGAQTLAATTTFNNLSISGATFTKTLGTSTIVNGTLTLNTNVTLNANSNLILGPGGNIFYNGGVITNYNGTPNSITLNGGTVVPPTTVDNLTLNSSTILGGSVTVIGTINLVSGSLSIAGNTLTINGDITGSGGFTGGTTSNIIIGGSGASTTLPSVSLNTFQVSRPNGINLGGALTTNSSLTIDANCQLTAGSFTHTVKGNWVNNGTLNAVTSKFVMNGTTPQTMHGSTFYDLEINNPSGVTLETSDIVTHLFTLTNGTVTLGTNDLIVSSISGGSSSSYIITNGTGTLIQNVGTSPVTFPIGFVASDYTPITFSNETPQNYNVRVRDVTPNLATTGLDRQWVVQETIPSTSKFKSLTLSWTTNSMGSLGAPLSCDLVANITGSRDLYDPLKTGLDGSGYSVSDNTLDYQFADIHNNLLYITVVGYNAGLPVELSSFTSSVNGRDVSLDWKTMTEKNSNKFEVERLVNQNWINVGSVKAAVLSNSPKLYSFTDKNLQTGNYQYRLKIIDNDGTFAYSKVTEAVVSTPKSFELSQNYPNPFNPSTRIGYQLPVDSKVTLEVYNIVGQRVATIVNEEQSAGYYTVNFSATSYRNITSGVYIYKLTAVDNAGKNSSSIKKMMLLK